MTDDLREEFILEAQKAFEFRLDVVPETVMGMEESDHGYTEWLIAPLYIADSNGTEKVTMIVEDAGESQRQFTLLVREEDEAFILIHSYFKPDIIETYEISGGRKFHK